MTAFPKYPKYKDSGVEWLGDVPEHWEVNALRACAALNVERNRPDLPVLSVYREYGVILKDSRDDNHNATSLDTSNYKVVHPGDLAVNKMKAWQGSLGVSEHHGIVSPAYITCKVNQSKVAGRYLHYLLRSKPLIGALDAISYGVRVGQWDMRFEDFKQVSLTYPPRAEQERIVAFLDEKTAEIDRLIAKKQRQIELLDEQKAILINRAVTRGLHPQAELQDSGIPWIGPIPKGWEVKSAKHACERIIDCKNRTAEVVTNGDYYVLRTSNVKKGELVRDEITRTNLKNFTIWTERGAPQAGDVLFTREAPAGEACVYDGSLPACLGQRMMYFRPDISQLLPQFLVHTIYYGPSATYIQLKTNGSTVGHLRLPDVYALPVLLPPVEEQQRILDSLATTEETQKKLIQTVQSQIQTLQTLRSTLIAHAVTGKIAIPAATA
jgi:type I restriction enzyme S subunit